MVYLEGMRTIPRSAVLSLLIVVASCGQVEPVLLTVSMPDCTFRGTTEMEPGEASLSLSLNGLGNAKALLVELVGGHSYDELAAHLEQGDEFGGGSKWTSTVIEVELSDTDGIDGIADSTLLDEGEYAVICVDLETGAARAASPLRVAESVYGFENGRGGERGRRP